MEVLSYKYLENKAEQKDWYLKEAPEKVLQFGEGNFLRAFVDYFIDIMNEKAGFNGKVVLTQPIAQGTAELINAQDGLFTLYQRGVQNGEQVNDRRVVSSVSRCINPYEDYQALLACAANPDLRFIVSNTTEAGIVFEDDSKFDQEPPSSFPAKLTRFLYERYQKGLPGFIILSCELIDNNGLELKRCVDQYIKLWQLPEAFASWNNSENVFCSTLVDRIVTGYPRAEVNQLNEQNGYIDNIVDTCEIFAFWVIEGPQHIAEEMPFAAAGLPVIVTDDHSPYKQRKVRILNGAHTSMVPAAWLAGQNIVRECMQDEVIADYMNQAIFAEIIPTLSLPEAELRDFAASVAERFRNPYIDHSLLAISLNSISKWKARVMPSVLGYHKVKGELPKLLTFSFAALIEFYSRGCKIDDGSFQGSRDNDKYEIKDDQWIIDFFTEQIGKNSGDLMAAVVANERMWDDSLLNLPGFAEQAARYLEQIRAEGSYAVMKSLI